MMRLRNSILTALLLIPLVAGSVSSATNRPVWRPAGYGGGGRFTNLAVDPTNPQIVYVGSDVAGVFRSRDGGGHFELVGKGLGGFNVADIAINPAPPHQLAALTNEGLYYSMNQGDDWIRISSEIPYDSNSFGSHLLLFTRSSLWVATDKKGVFKLPLSNLQASPQPAFGLEGSKINGLAVYDGYLYAGTNRGVFRLEKQTWKPQQQGLLPGAVEIMDIASSKNALYVLEKQNGLFRWNASSLTWENCAVSLQPKPKAYKALLVHPNNPNLIFIGSHPEYWPHLLYKTQDGGSTWKSILSFKVDPEAPLNWTSTLSNLEEMAFVPGTSPALFMTDWWNVWKSTDNGENWHQRHHGLQNTCVNDVKMHPRNPKILYLCAWDNGLMISEDSGTHWRRAMNGIVKDGHAQEIEISKKDPARMFLLVNLRGKQRKIHVYESQNSGTNWKDIGFSVPIETLSKQGYVDGTATNLELDPFSEDTIYVGTNGYGVYKTIDAGRTWSPVNQGLNSPFIKGPGALLAHPHIPGTLFASTLAGGIYKSTNGANSWQRVTTGDRFIFGMAIDPAKPSRIAAGCSGNTLLISNDEGKSWRETRLPVNPHPAMAINSVAFHPLRPGAVLAGTLRYDSRATEGLFMSIDNARTFRPVPMAIPKVSVSVMTPAVGESASVYVGFIGTGIFRLELGEKH